MEFLENKDKIYFSRNHIKFLKKEIILIFD